MSIKSFKHKGLRVLFYEDKKTGIQAEHYDRLRAQLARLNVSSAPQDMNKPGWKLHALTGDRKGDWAVTVSGNWRMTFRFEGSDAILVNYEDYH